MKKREDRLELRRPPARRRSSRGRAAGPAARAERGPARAWLAARRRVRRAARAARARAWTRFAPAEPGGREHRHRVAEGREQRRRSPGRARSRRRSRRRAAPSSACAPARRSRRRCRRRRRRCWPRRRRPGRAPRRARRASAPGRGRAARAPCPAIVSSITRRRPMRSERRPQSGAHRNCAAA